MWRLVRGDVSAPWLLGALSLVCIALAARLVIELMGLRRPLWKVLTCALMTVSQTVTMLNATYGPWVDTFMLSMLLAVVSVWLLERGGGRGFVGGAVCLAASLALYQSYVSMALGLMLLLFIDRALRGKAEYPPRALFAWAVSYTHLDVYKRQRVHGAKGAGRRHCRPSRWGGGGNGRRRRRS